ncbi:hypothetical protein PoB_001602200 [Plakobranchus ocellatus]|uniref:Uncharacterized protein n=1 Tax=Plakobranchus ocellatus TaxID=259542 RepID=A0AAV3Z4N9_9GAST|nr:hypothetical protein PoB_001602200 [Plakobranchus ocellatus]
MDRWRQTDRIRQREREKEGELRNKSDLPGGSSLLSVSASRGKGSNKQSRRKDTCLDFLNLAQPEAEWTRQVGRILAVGGEEMYYTLKIGGGGRGRSDSMTKSIHRMNRMD